MSRSRPGQPRTPGGEVPAKPCSFCEIAAGRKDAARVFEAEATVAFLDHRPLFPGHVLVVPRAHIETLSELPAASLTRFFAAVQLLAEAVERGMAAQGSFVAINNRVSQSVPHLHAHVVPRSRGDGLRGFFWPRQTYDGPEHLARVAAAIREALRALQEPSGVL
jgi:histidine triad (HIT) family protein